MKPEPRPSHLHRIPDATPFGRRIEYRTYADLTPGTSSVASAPLSAIRQAARVGPSPESAVGGLLIAGARRGSAAFRNVRVATSGEPLRQADPDAIILPARQYDQAAATTAVEVAADEPVLQRRRL